MTPYRSQSQSWVNTTDSIEHLRIYGGNSFFSQVNLAIMATRATSFNYEVQTAIEFYPSNFSQSAGLVGLYYDSNNWLYARICLGDDGQTHVLRVMQAKLGERLDLKFDEIEFAGAALTLKFTYQFGKATAHYRITDSDEWSSIQKVFDVTYLSDEGVNGGLVKLADLLYGPL